MLGIDHSCTCHVFLARWPPYLFRCSSTCWNWHFPIPNGTMRHSSLAIPSCSLLSLTLWKPSGLVLSRVIVFFFGRLPTWVGVYFTSDRCSFIYHASTFSLMCGSKDKHLVISSSYHINLLSIPKPLIYNTMYLFWITTSLGGPSFMVSMWSCHWLSRHPFTLMPLQKWTYNNPRYISVIIIVIVLENGTHVQREVSHLLLHHTQRQVDIFIMKDGFWTLMDIVIADLIHINMMQWTLMTTTQVMMMVVQEKTWWYVKQTLGDDFIPFVIETYMGVFIIVLIHFWSFVHKPLLHIINDLFNPLDACCLLSTTHVHNPVACTSHNDSSMGYCTWSRFLISSTHHS